MKNPISSDRLKPGFRAVAVGFNVLAAMATVFTGYSGCIDPDVMPFAGLAGMTFAGWVVLSILLLAVNLVFCRKLAILPAMALICTIGPILTFSPLNRSPKELTPDQQRRSFKVLNYNVLSFHDDPQKQNPDSVNRTMQYIMDSGADVVCLQECYFLIPFEHYGLYQPQIDALKEIYPYYFVGRQGQTVLSKYPFMNIPLPKDHMDAGDFAAYRMNIKGHPITIFNVHLQSIGLTVGDKELFLELTDASPEASLKRVRAQLISKLYHAYRQRARQARTLRSYIEQLGGNVVLCGDFNDVPGCYAVRALEKCGMHDAYAQTAFGPTITYNLNRFYFRIDQTLYKGDFKAVSVERGALDSSDHHPLLTTYVWDTDMMPEWHFESTSSPLYPLEETK
ncbi:MAG: endonuclease/exonuclease/phosphatase family protein [Muribaculaceae bacterium]|nr:endonuclease/exonuclease/phosphatase family protein [Muribaculaceae bacterium]